MIFVCQGVVIGKLTVIREYSSNSYLPDHVPSSYRNQGVVFECQCECGKLAYYPEKFLAQRKVESCGCIRVTTFTKAVALKKPRSANTTKDERKGELWREARAKNLRKQIISTRKKIAFWKSIGATENLTLARRDMISLKSKLADITKPK